MSFSAVLRQIPLPIFGNANLAIQFTSKIARKAPNYAGWLVPLGVGGAWFIWPAVSDESKVFLGLLPDPEATKAAAELAEGLNKSMADEMDQDAIDNAHKRIDSTEEDIDKHLRRLRGDYSDLHTQWERSTVASLMMLDDEEEVDEEEEEEDDDEEDEDEEGGDEESEEGGEGKGGDDDDEDDDDDEE